MPIHFSINDYMRGEDEEIRDVDIFGGRVKAFLEISVTKRRLIAVAFTFNIGSARFAPDEAKFYLSGPAADYTVYVKAVSSYNLLAGFEEKLAPYVDKFINKLVSREEVAKIYDGLVGELEDALRGMLTYMRNLYDVEVGEV